MADQLLQEVDADLRADRLHQLWTRYKKTLLLAIALVLLATGADTVWQNYREKKGGELFYQIAEAQTLFNQGKFDEAATGFAKAADTTSGQAHIVAQLWQGRALAKAGKKDEAIAVLKSAAADRSLWGDLACLRLAGLDSSAATCLSDSHDSPLINKRREWFAATAWEQGKTQDAITTFEELATSSDTTEITRSEINGWLSTLRAGEKPAAEAKSAASKKADKPAAEKTSSDTEEKSAE